MDSNESDPLRCLNKKLRNKPSPWKASCWKCEVGVGGGGSVNGVRCTTKVFDWKGLKSHTILGTTCLDHSWRGRHSQIKCLTRKYSIDLLKAVGRRIYITVTMTSVEYSWVPIIRSSKIRTVDNLDSSQPGNNTLNNTQDTWSDRH